MEPDAKLRWALEHQLFRQPFLRHEVFGLIKSSFKEASEETKQLVWEAARNADEDRQPADREVEPIFARLLSEVDPEFEPATKTLEAFADRHPEWEPSPHPEFLTWFEAGWEPASSDLPAAEQLHDLAALLQAERDDSSAFAHAELRDSITAAVSQSGSLGVELLEGLASAAQWDSVIWRGATWGLQQAELSEDDWSRLLNVVETHPDADFGLGSLSAILLDAIRAEPQRITPRTFEDAARVLESLVQRFLNEGRDTEAPREDLMFEALNSWPGRVPQYIVQSAARLEVDGDDPCEAPGLRTFLTLVHEAPESNWAQVSAAALGRLFPYLWERCHGLVEDLLLPNLSWDQPAIARAAWTGLAYARWSRQTVEALYRYLPRTAARIVEFEERARRGITNTLAGIATTYGENPIAPEGWLRIFARNSDDTTMADFAHSVRRHVSGLPEDERRTLWNSWLQDYWSQRSQGFPRAIGPLEGSAMLHWVYCFESELEEVEPLVLQLPLAPHGWGFLRDLVDTSLAARAPNSTLRVMHHVLSNADQLFDPESATQLLTTAAEHGAGHDEIQSVCSQLVRLGTTPPELCN